MMAPRWITVLIAINVVIATSGCATSYKLHPEFKTRHPLIQRVAALPPDVEVYRLTFRGDRELLSELIPKVTTMTQDEVEKVFTRRGYQVQKLDLSESVLQQDSELRTALFTVREMFKQTVIDIGKRKQKKFTYALSPSEINQFAELAQADVLIFVKCDAYKKSAGEIAKDVVKSILVGVVTLGGVTMYYYPAAAVFHVAVVDGNTGDLLWYNHNMAMPQADVAKEKELRAAVRSVFHVFPKRAGFKKPKVSPTTPQAIPVPTTPVSPTVPTPEPAPQLPARP